MNAITEPVEQQEAPKKRRGRPPKTAFDVGRKKLKEIADRAAKPSGALDQYVKAGRLLRAAVRDRVDAVDDDELLAAALALHESAETFVKA